MRWVAKTHKAQEITGKALLQEKVTPRCPIVTIAEGQLTNKITVPREEEMKDSSGKATDEEFISWISGHDNGLSKSEGPSSFSIHMIGARNVGRSGEERPRKGSEREREGGGPTQSNINKTEEMFNRMLIASQKKITIGELIQEGKWPTESITEYIIRWQNLSRQCETQMSEACAVSILLKCIRDYIDIMSPVFDADTFQELLDRVAQSTPAKDEASSQSKGKASKHKSQEKGLVVIEPSKPKGPNLSLQHKQNKEYSFSSESVEKIFDLMMEAGFQLREPKRSQEAHLVGHPNYCRFHRSLGHTLEDCFVFKDLVEKKYQSKEISLSKSFLLTKTATDGIKINHRKASKSEGDWKEVPSWNIEEQHNTTTIQRPIHGYTQIDYQTIIQQGQEKIALLETKNETLKELMHELINENVKLKEEVRGYRMAFIMKTVDKIPKTTSNQEKEIGGSDSSDEKHIKGLSDIARSSTLLDRASLGKGKMNNEQY